MKIYVISVLSHLHKKTYIIVGHFDTCHFLYCYIQWPITKSLSQLLLKVNEKINTQITYLEESGDNQLM